MSSSCLIFEIEQKPVYKIADVFGVKIPLYGEFTVAETIAIEKAELEITSENPSVTEKLRAWFKAWLIIRLDLVNKAIAEKRKDPKAVINLEEIKRDVERDVLAQLDKSTALLDALWEVYKGERFGIIVADDDDEPVTEGKELESSEPSKTSKRNGTKSTSSSQIADLQQNSLVILDNSVSA